MDSQTFDLENRSYTLPSHDKELKYFRKKSHFNYYEFKQTKEDG